MGDGEVFDITGIEADAVSRPERIDCVTYQSSSS